MPHLPSLPPFPSQADVYNVLVHVIDHGTVTDNHDRQADFRQVILIIIANVGAREAASIAFKGLRTRGDMERRTIRLHPDVTLHAHRFKNQQPAMQDVMRFCCCI